MDYTLAEAYKRLRLQALQLTAAQAGIADLVYGVVMETGYPETVVTLLPFRGGLYQIYNCQTLDDYSVRDLAAVLAWSLRQSVRRAGR